MPRYTIDFDDNFDKALTELTNSTDAKTKAEVIRRAVASYKYLKNQESGDSKVSVTKDGKIVKDVILP